MKFSIERAALLKAVAQAQSVVERRNTIPILANVLIEAQDNDVRFRATDLDIEVVDRADAHVERAGATTVSAVMLHEIVRKLPDGALVTLTDDGRDALFCAGDRGRALPAGSGGRQRAGAPWYDSFCVAEFCTRRRAAYLGDL